MNRSTTLAPLFGRETELTALCELVRKVRQGGRIAIVEGEAGIGKTRLVDATLDSARSAGVSVFAARADELGQHRPFAAILDLLSDPSDSAARERLVGAMSVEGRGVNVEGERQFRVSEATLELVEERCARSPVILAVEDLHWADPGTLGVIAQLARGIGTLPAGLIVSSRPHPRRRELDRLLPLLESLGATRSELGPLDSGACTDLVEALLGAPPGPRLVSQAAGAAGNPFFLSELIATLLADAAIQREGGVAEVAATQQTPPLPITILHRLSFLPSDELELLGLASVLGTSFSAADLALVSHRPVAELVPALRSALRAGVLHELDGRLAFRHDLIRDALYEDMSLSVRRALHSELAGLFTQAGEPPERMTDHLLRAAVPGDARSLDSLVTAARELADRAPSAAVELFSRAIELSPQPVSARADLLPELAETLVTAGWLSEGEAACREAIEHGLDPAVAARLRLKLAMLLTRRPRTGAAMREAETALAADNGQPVERARLRGWLALARLFEGDVEGAVSEAGIVMDGEPDLLARALALDTLALAASADGRFLESAELIAESARDVEALGSREAYDSCPHMILGLQLARLDRLDEAYTVIQRGRRASEALGMVDTLASFHYQLALVEMLRGRLDDALAELATHGDYAQQTGAGWSIPADSVRSLIALHRGDLLAAEEHVSSAERAAADGAPRHGIEVMVLARGRVLEATGQMSAALDVLAGAMDTAEAAYYPVIGPELARLAMLMHEPDRASGILPPLERIATLNPGVRSLEAARLQTHGWLDRDGSALVAAAELMRETGRSLEAARAAEDAAAAIAPEQTEPARELLEHARAAYETSGAPHDLARADAALRSLGARRGVRGPRQRPSSGWEALTDTELKVVRLVAERLTNPEIAERLFISRRTVQTHVSHALAKLGVPSRKELAAEAARRAGWRIRLDGGTQQLQESEPAGEPAARSPVHGEDA